LTALTAIDSKIDSKKIAQPLERKEERRSVDSMTLLKGIFPEKTWRVFLLSTCQCRQQPRNIPTTKRNFVDGKMILAVNAVNVLAVRRGK